MFSNCSCRNKKENSELNKGEKESKGIVRLNSDSLIDLRKIKAEKIPRKINIKPGIKYAKTLR